MEVEIKEGGIFIPKELLKSIGLEDFEVEMSETELRIRPKSYTRRMFSYFKANKRLVDKAIEDYENDIERRYLRK